jgi:hypothetical protein
MYRAVQRAGRALPRLFCAYNYFHNLKKYNYFSEKYGNYNRLQAAGIF